MPRKVAPKAKRRRGRILPKPMSVRRKASSWLTVNDERFLLRSITYDEAASWMKV